MSHQPRLSKALQRAQAGKLKRKNSLSVHQGQLEFQLSLEQAQSIQARLPGDIWLINTNPEQFQKTKEQIRLACMKSMESQQRRPEFIHDHDSQKGPAEIPKKKGHAGPRKTHPEEPSPLAQSQPQHEERTPKEVIHKRKGPKYNNDAQLEYQVPLLKKQEKNRIEQQIAWMKPNEEALEMIPQPSMPALEETFGTMANPSSSAIPSLLSGLPRYIEPSQQELEGTTQINNLRYIFGLRHRQPSEHGLPRLNEKQKSFCSNICQRLKSHRSSQPFRVAVDPESQRVPDYYYVIYNPMDLQTIQKKISKDKYCEISEFHADINQIILNSYKYNLRETVYFSATVEFEDYYHELLGQAQKNPEEFIRDHMPKVSKKKPIPNSGERDFIEKTPLKEKKRLRGRRLNLNLSHRLKSRKEENRVRDQSQEDSAMNEESIVEPSVTTRNLDKTGLRNISLMRAQSMPLESEAGEIFEPSFEHMNTQSNNPIPKHRKRNRKPCQTKEKEKSRKPRQKNSGIHKDKSRRGELKADSIHADNQKMQEMAEEIQKDNQQKSIAKQKVAMEILPQGPEREPSVASQQKSKLSREQQSQKNMLQDDYDGDDQMFDIYFGDGNQEEEPANKMKEERDEQPDLGPLAMEDIILANPYEPNKQAQPMDQEAPKEQAPKQEAIEMKPEQKASPSEKSPKRKKQANSKQITMYISKAGNERPNPMEEEKKTSQKYFTSVNFDGEEQSITVNNLNTHPQSHPELIELSKEQQKEIEKKSNEEMYVEVSIPAKPTPDKKPKGKGKGKRKHVDDAYVASSGDEEYVVSVSRYSKKNKNRIRKKEADRDSNSNGSTRRRRGRRSNRQIEAARRQAELAATVTLAEGQQEAKKQEFQKLADSKQSKEQARQMGDIFMEPQSEKKDPTHLVAFNFDDI